LARKRRVDLNPPMGKKEGDIIKQMTVMASERVQTYAKEPFTMSNRKLLRLSQRVIT
jgi:hypothetical protein